MLLLTAASKRVERVAAGGVKMGNTHPEKVTHMYSPSFKYHCCGHLMVAFGHSGFVLDDSLSNIMSKSFEAVQTSFSKCHVRLI